MKLETGSGRRIAYDLTEGAGPGVVFLGGFRSDKEGTKALHLEAWARRAGRAFLRFDYSGHGQSSGAFEDGTIGAWAEDAREAVTALTEGPQILVGSSMGGWIALLLAREMPGKVAGLVGIAAAPDFTEDEFWDGFDEDQRERLRKDGRLEMPNPYGDEPNVVTMAMIEDGRRQLVLRAPLRLPMPSRFLLGTADEEVPVALGVRLIEHVEGDDIRMTLVKGADHRFSSPACLALIEAAIGDVSG